MTRRWVAMAVLAAGGLLGGCGRAPALGPPEVRVGQDTCHECGMTVSDVRYAAAVVVLRDGAEESFVFDDAGEMLAFTVPAGAGQVRRYAHDFGTGQWIDADAAYYVRASDLHTPMGTGVVAYAAERDARAAAEKYHGKVEGVRSAVALR